MYLQLWALGRAASVEQLKREDPSFEYVSRGCSFFPREPLHEEEYGDHPPRPRPLTKDEIVEYVQLYATAARNAVERAVLMVSRSTAQMDTSRSVPQRDFEQRMDEYGGSPENNARFVLDVVAAVSEAVGEERVGLRLSPWLTIFGMRILLFPRTGADVLLVNSASRRDREPGKTIQSLCSPIS